MRREIGLKAAGAGLAALFMASPAMSAIYNIGAADTVGTHVTFDFGKTYLIEWIGVADGGLYDAAGGIGFGGPTGFSNAFTVRDDATFGSNSYDIDIISTGQVYATAGQSLAAYQSGAGINDVIIHFQNGVPGAPQFDSAIPHPWVVIADQDVSYHLIVTDATTRTDNTGGISLRITAVPEPGTWALMILGFGGVGVAMRRRREAAA